jgi:hypothetical protein
MYTLHWNETTKSYQLIEITTHVRRPASLCASKLMRQQAYAPASLCASKLMRSYLKNYKLQIPTGQFIG